MLSFDPELFDMVSYRCSKCMRLCEKDDPDICNECTRKMNSKMYIAIHEDVPDHMVPVLVAHSVLGAHKAFSMNPFSESDFDSKTKQNYENWFKNSFRKVTVSVNQKEFDKIAELEDVYLGHENTTLEGRKSCIVVCPRDEYPNVIKFSKLWKPKNV